MKSRQLTYQHFHAPEIFGDHWFNSEPLSIRELHGRPALLFFCDRYSPQSQQLVPLINGLHALYYEYGLTCIGIHSPEFQFGKDPKRIEQWIKKDLVLFPVLADNEHPITDAYRISTIPSICLIDNKGDVYDTITGSFTPERIERSVQFLLRQSGYRGELPILLNPALDTKYLMAGEVVREIYTGYHHGALGNPEGYNPELASQYIDPKIYFDGKFYAHGIWRAERSCIISEGNPGEDYLMCRTEGDEVNILLECETKATVKIEIDGEPIRIVNIGNDVQKGKQGDTFITVEEPRLFSVLKRNNSESRTLKFIPQSAGVRFYMITFETRSSSSVSKIDESFRNN
ncbi:MAG: redoxin domain-containing protein [Ignavibacteriales bacterium]|nr:redoxin domain-containing protein [Ignavibacteriales bacterium]